MLKNVSGFLFKKQKEIQNNFDLKSKTLIILDKFINEDILRNQKIDYKISLAVNKGVIKIKTNNKLVDQEIALRIRSLEMNLKNSGVEFKKVLI